MMSKAPTRVLFAVPVPPPYSGPEMVGDLLLKTGLDDGLQILHVSTTVNKYNRQKGILSITTVMAGLRLWLAVVKSLLRYRPKVLYLFLSQNRLGFIRDTALIATARVFRTPAVVHVHGGNFERFFAASGPFLRLVIRRVLAACRLVLVSGRTFFPQFSGLVVPERMRVVDNPVDLRAFDAPGLPAHDARGCRILFVGHLSHAKGFGDVLSAMETVLERNPTTSLQCIGEWLSRERNIRQDAQGKPVASDMQALVGRWDHLNGRYPGRLRQASHLSEAEKRITVKSADIFVLPSYSEGLPIAVLEAMAAGLPMVLTPVGALPEILTEENALFVRTGDVDALKQALIRLVESPDLRSRMGAANRRLAAERFTPETISRSLSACFQECLS